MPTGCGKTGLATAFLLQAIDRGYRGYFVTFPELVAQLYASLADHSEEKVIKKYAAYDCLVIDEVGYVEVEPTKVGLFFTLMQKRHQTKTTLITSGRLYADRRGNAVFLLLGKAGQPVGAELRGTSARVWRGMAPRLAKEPRLLLDRCGSCEGDRAL